MTEWVSTAFGMDKIDKNKDGIPTISIKKMAFCHLAMSAFFDTQVESVRIVSDLYEITVWRWC